MKRRNEGSRNRGNDVVCRKGGGARDHGVRKKTSEKENDREMGLL